MKKISVLILIVIQLNNLALAQKKEATFHKISENLHMLSYDFPNMFALVGGDGILLVDTNLKDNMPTIYDALQKKFKNLAVKYVINTHMHDDHIGGNSLLIDKGAVIITHEFTRMALGESYYIDENGHEVDDPKKGKLTRDFEEEDLPQITFKKKMNLFFNDENIEIIHVEDAHTKGDVIVYFKKNNVIALGDNYFGDAYTFGANIKGMIKVLEDVLLLINDKTIVAPGHGVLSNKKELQAYLSMIKDVKSKVELEIKNGKSLEQVKANISLTEKYDDKYGKLYMKGENFRELIFKSGSQ